MWVTDDKLQDRSLKRKEWDGLSKEHEYWHMHAHHILALSFPLHSSQIPAS